MDKQREVRISACIIMRDAAKDIGKCLESIRGLVDEIVVVDTGSVDGSREIAERCGGRVYEFPWKEDFSAAKNYAIEQATGDWILFLDSDEWLTEETREHLRPILSADGLRENVDALSVKRLNISTGTGERIGEDMAERIFRRDAALRYHDPIHECLGFTDGRKLRSLDLEEKDLAIWHTGYSPERAREKSDRNVRMLEALRDRGVEKLYLYYYLAREYLYREAYEKAAKAAGEAIRRKECPGDPALPYLQLCEAQEAMGDGEGSLGTLRAGMEAYPIWPRFFLEYGRRMRARGRRKEALLAMEQAVQKEEILQKKLPDRRREELSRLYGELAELLEEMGRRSKARNCRKKARDISRPGKNGGR